MSGIMALLIGSRAMKYWVPMFRTPLDWDFFITSPNLKTWADTNRDNIRELRPSNLRKYLARMRTGETIEFEIDSDQSTGIALATVSGPTIQLFGLDVAIPPVHFSYATKYSHLYSPDNWNKTIHDYHAIREVCGDDFGEFAEYARIRRMETERRRRSRQYSLNVSNEEFFDSSERLVGRVYEHDDLHLAVAYYDRPLYERAKKDPSRALLSEKLWDKFTLEDKIRMVREEAYVIALERKIIPVLEGSSIGKAIDAARKPSADAAFAYGLMRICTTLTRGWFRDFAIEHWPTIRTYDVNYIHKFAEAREKGLIRLRPQPHKVVRDTEDTNEL